MKSDDIISEISSLFHNEVETEKLTSFMIKYFEIYLKEIAHLNGETFEKAFDTVNQMYSKPLEDLIISGEASKFKSKIEKWMKAQQNFEKEILKEIKKYSKKLNE